MQPREGVGQPSTGGLSIPGFAPTCPHPEGRHLQEKCSWVGGSSVKGRASLAVILESGPSLQAGGPWWPLKT